MGKHGTGVINNNGERLVDFCGLNHFVITGTLFPHKEIHKNTWTSDKRTNNQIDHVLINKKYRSSVRDTRVMRGADAASDYQLVRTQIKLKLKKQDKKANPRMKYDVSKLQNPAIKNQFSVELKDKFAVLEAVSDDVDIEAKWDNFYNAFNQSAKEVLGTRKRKQKPWIGVESWKKVEERKHIKMKIENAKSIRIKQQLQAEYKAKDKEVKSSMRSDKRKWVDSLAGDAQRAAENGQMKTLYELTKTICNEKPRHATGVKDKQGNIITDEEGKRTRWKAHFEEILNRDFPTNPVVKISDDIPELETIDTTPVTKAEVKNAIKKLKNGKAGGVDLLTPELLKADIDTTANKLHSIICDIWDQEKIPKDWKKGLIVKLPKKGDLNECANWRGITLLPIASKILGRIVIDRIKIGIDKKLRPEQAGFRQGKSTTEQIFILRNIEQSIEWQSSLYINFIDFEKAFDSIHQGSLWEIMRQYGIPGKIINIVKLMYSDSVCAVLDDGKVTEWFQVKTGKARMRNVRISVSSCD
ncbi:endonuclease-reverse transcriptase [Apostichopus japonicus]|uniref:Endonuclease-reverse transcriptase n=1 Tax=Stichopus japonicus TaxID=307972 RepID=A0A2G8K194_STIJA|nr:endonuclease-reverse transcriptase [Apostichopus japonicus]